MVGHPGPRPSARRRGHAGLPYPQARRRAGRSDRRLGPGEVDGRSAPPSRRRADAARRVHGAARGEPRAGYPVRPSHLLHITYEARPNASTTLIVQTVRDAGRWYVTAFCPKPGTRAQIDAARAAAPRVAAAQAQRVQTLITGMPPALEQQVLDLVKQGQKIAAIRHYEREAGVDLTTAKDVVDRLIEPGR